MPRRPLAVAAVPPREGRVVARPVGPGEARAGRGRRRRARSRRSSAPGAAFHYAPGHGAPRHRARGHDDPRGLDAAARRRRAARGRLRARRARPLPEPNLHTTVIRLAPMQAPLTVGAAAAQTGWSAADAPLPRGSGARRPAAHERRLPRLRPLRAEPAAKPARPPGAVRASTWRSSRSRAAPPRRRPAPCRRRWLAARPRTPARGSSGSSASTSGFAADAEA